MITKDGFKYPKHKLVPSFYNIRRIPKRGWSCSLANTIFDCGGQITIGRNVVFAHNCMVLTGTHDYSKRGAERKHTVSYKPVTIGNGVWICSGAIILPGVTIGKNAVIGAGSVVTKDVPADELWFGNPARFHKKI